MSDWYKGLRIPRGLNGDNIQKLELENDQCAVLGTPMGRDDAFCSGIFCDNCICNRAHRTELREFVRMCNKGNGVLRPGMVVRFDTKCWCLVWSVDAEEVRGLRIYAEPEKLPKFGSVVNIPYEHIEKGYKLKSAGEYGIPSGQHINVLLLGNGAYWEESYSPVLELTIEDVEKKFGRKVKIVGEKDA